VLEGGASHQFVWSTQGGVSNYLLEFDVSNRRDSISTEADRIEYRQEKPLSGQTQIRFSLMAEFGELPLRSLTQFTLPVVPGQ